MRKIKFALAAVLVTIGVTAAAAFASTKTSTVSLRTTKVGKALVAANGRTLYLFTADKGRKSSCYGKCAAVWPPLAAAYPTVGRGLRASLLGTKPGDVRGEGVVHFGGSWWLVSPAGTEITRKPY